MKKIGILIVFIMLIASWNSAWAWGIKEGSFSLSPVVGGYTFEGNQNTKNAATYGVRAGYNFTPNWGLEGFFQYTPTLFDDTNNTNHSYLGGIEGLYHFRADDHFVPFVAAGVGGYHFSDDRTRGVPTNLAVDYGAGFKYFITRNVALRADVRHILILPERYNDLLCTFGFDFSIGGKGKPVVAEAVAEEPPTPAPVVAAVKPQETPAPAPVVAEAKPQETPAPAPVVTEAKPQEMPAPAPVVAETKPQEAPTPAPAPAPEIAKTEAKPVPERLSIQLNVEFDKNKAVVKKQYHNNIKTVAVFMKARPASKTIIVGYTDNMETRKNKKKALLLSQARANCVRQYLIKKFHVDASRITAVGYGMKKPVASNATEQGRKQNRRVEAVIVAVQKK